MKHILVILLICLVSFGCKKDKVPSPKETKYYQSNGNLLILKIDDYLEGVYEYHLASTVLNNDSLPLFLRHFQME